MSIVLQRLRWGTTLVSCWLLVACVTVNIYFPAAAAEQAADQIIEDVWGTQPEDSPPAAGPAQGWLHTTHQPLVSWNNSLLNLLIPSAQAQSANINIATPAINTLKNAMAARHNRLEAYYQSGAVGLTNDGLITVRDLNAVPLPERNLVNQLVAEENRDRTALYREIAKANNQPQWEPDIRATFARRWIDNARSGWWYQDGSGAWRQK